MPCATVAALLASHVSGPGVACQQHDPEHSASEGRRAHGSVVFGSERGERPGPGRRCPGSALAEFPSLWAFSSVPLRYWLCQPFSE